MTTLPPKEYLRPDEVAKYWSVSKRTIYVWIETGKLKAVKIGRLLRIPRQEVESIKEIAE